ncbi:MAG: TonB-dependent receptor domain-containing protein [Rhizomicrobium sp.]
MLKNLLLVGGSVAALLSATNAFAADANAPEQLETVVVFGQGQTRQIQELSQADLRATVPGTSPLKVVSKLPGVNYQAADAFGAYEWAVRISVRGFNQNQLGFTLDDVPLGDMSYGNDNGLHISRAISSENIGRIELAQGTGDLGTASTSNLGGTLKFHSVDPSDTFGVYTTATGGVYDTAHAFVRLETGDIGTGGKAYVSYGLQYADKWKGEGAQKQQLVNAKFEQPLGSAALLTGFLNHSERRENDYQDQSLALLSRLGYKSDNISNNYPLAEKIAEVYQNQQAVLAGMAQPYAGVGLVFPAPYTTVDDVYFNASGLRNDTLGGLKADWNILDNLALHVTGYGHNNKGQGLWYTPYVPTPGGGPISVRTTEYGINRYGVNSSLDWTIANHQVEAGVWYENNVFHQARRFYGLSLATADRPSLQFQSNPFFTQWEYRFNTTTLVFHLQDSWQITDALKFDFGFKTQQVNISSHIVQGAAIAGTIKSSADFLPQVGVNYRLDDSSEFFADYSANQRAFVGAATAGPFSTSQSGFNAIKDKLKPETSATYEGGYRAHFGDVEGVLAAYFVKFGNRLLTETVGAGIVGNPSVLSNVGSVTTKGIEAAGTWRFHQDWWLFGSYAYNDSQYDDDTFNGNGVLDAHTAGKTVVDSPRNLLKAELGYDDGAIFGNLNLSYMSKRFYTYLNDASVPDQTIVDLNLGYRFGSDTMLEGLEVQANITNLFDERYVATVGSNGFINSDPAGTFQTLLPGAPREAFITLRKSF